jgi:hypothetical protein
LRDRQSEQRNSVGFLEIRPECFNRLPGCRTILNTVFEQLTVVIAYVARHVV